MTKINWNITDQELKQEMVEGVLILRNSSLKLKSAAGNAILLKSLISLENISERTEIKTEH